MRWMLFVAFVCPAAIAANPGDKTAKEKQPTHTEIDAVGWAFDALLKYPEDRRACVRFVYLPPWADPEWIGVMDFAVNSACGHSRNLHRADRHAGGWLLGYDLSKYATGAKLERLLSVWDGCATDDPYFHISRVNQDGGPLPVLAPHLGEALARHATSNTAKRVDTLVADMTGSTGAVYRADWFLEQLLTSIRGRYPEFRQIEFDPEGPHTPLQSHMKKRGFFLEQSIGIGGEKGALLLISGVTGKSRVILTVFGLGSRTPLVTTYDFADRRTRPDEQFIRNLLSVDAFADAAEVFVPMPNGLLEFVLADGKGQIQRSAPPDVVADSTKPDGHTKELEMGMSCIMCHTPNNGYNTARNDMELLIGADVDLFADGGTVGGKHLTRDELVDVVAGRYGERIDEPDGLLGRARRDYVRSVARLTDYTIEAEGPSAVARLGQKIKEIYHGYRYARVTPERVCLELGVACVPGAGPRTLRRLVPAVNQTTEDILIALLRNGAVIKRDDLEAIYAEMARRATANRPALLEAL